MDRETTLKKISDYSFHQTVDLGDGITTPGKPVSAKQRRVIELIQSFNLSDKRVVDLGTANGLFATTAEKQGAKEVLAVDHTEAYIDSLRNLILPRLQSNVTPVHRNMMDVSSDEFGQFDLVIFAGVLYHLRYPFTALKIVKDLVVEDGSLILGTGIIEDFNCNSVLYCPAPEDSPQETRGGNACSFFNQRALRETLQYFGFRILSETVTVSPFRRFVKKAFRKGLTRYRVSGTVIHCRRDSSLENRELVEFYESTTR